MARILLALVAALLISSARLVWAQDVQPCPEAPIWTRQVFDPDPDKVSKLYYQGWYILEVGGIGTEEQAQKRGQEFRKKLLKMGLNVPTFITQMIAGHTKHKVFVTFDKPVPKQDFETILR